MVAVKAWHAVGGAVAFHLDLLGASLVAWCVVDERVLAGLEIEETKETVVLIVDTVVADVSFVSLTKILAHAQKIVNKKITLFPFDS